MADIHDGDGDGAAPRHRDRRSLVPITGGAPPWRERTHPCPVCGRALRDDEWPCPRGAAARRTFPRPDPPAPA